MSMPYFLNICLILPLGILLQVVGYLQSVYRLTAAPLLLFIVSLGFVLAFSCLVWEIWYSRINLSQGARKIAIAGLVAVSVGYYILRPVLFRDSS
jgi:Na+(H+)/acetate symporter ActP